MHSSHRNEGAWRGVFFVMVDFFLALTIGELPLIGWTWEVVGMEWKPDDNGLVSSVLDCVDSHPDKSLIGNGERLDNGWSDLSSCWAVWLNSFWPLLSINDVCSIVSSSINSCGSPADVVFPEEKHKFLYRHGWS